jgi:hypothetical protein
MNNDKQVSFGRRIEKGIQAGVAKAIAEHKRAGRSIAIWQDGKVVIVPAKDIRVPHVRLTKNSKTKKL